VSDAPPPGPFDASYHGYDGIVSTYCRVPLARTLADIEGADAVIVGAPFDEGVSHRPGTRFGPAAIRRAEDIGHPPNRPSMHAGADPMTELRVIDYGDVHAVPGSIVRSHAALEQAVDEIIAAGAVPFVLGGDHSLSHPMLRSLAKRYGSDGYCVIHFDTHADTGAELDGVVETSHGTPFHTGIGAGTLRGDHVFQIGLRGNWPWPEEFQWMREQGFRWATMDVIEERGIMDVVREAIAWANDTAPVVYLTVDIDVLDPAFAPGTGTPEPGGLTTRELLRAVRTVAAGVDLAAMDLVEVSPPYDHAGVTALAGHRVVLDALTGFALRRLGREERYERP
jgi:agmatinase